MRTLHLNFTFQQMTPDWADNMQTLARSRECCKGSCLAHLQRSMCLHPRVAFLLKLWNSIRMRKSKCCPGTHMHTRKNRFPPNFSWAAAVTQVIKNRFVPTLAWAALRIAAATPPLCLRKWLAAFTIASLPCLHMSPLHRRSNRIHHMKACHFHCSAMKSFIEICEYSPHASGS